MRVCFTQNDKLIHEGDTSLAIMASVGYMMDTRR